MIHRKCAGGSGFPKSSDDPMDPAYVVAVPRVRVAVPQVEVAVGIGAGVAESGASSLSGAAAEETTVCVVANDFPAQAGNPP